MKVRLTIFVGQSPNLYQYDTDYHRVEIDRGADGSLSVVMWKDARGGTVERVLAFAPGKWDHYRVEPCDASV